MSSRIGKKPVEIPSGVTVELTAGEIKVKGPKGELKRSIHPVVKVEKAENKLLITQSSELKEHKGLDGLYRSLIANMVEGVAKGYEKRLEVIGVGYRFKISGNKISLSLGFSHPIEYKAQEGITFGEDPELKNLIIIKGVDKETVGETAAKIRSFRPPEPYKGKGIRYFGEYVPKKVGKTAAGATSGGA